MNSGVKTKKELEKVIIACKITDNIFSAVLKNFSRFKTEKDISLFIQREIKRAGCRLSFRPIVGTGGNASEIHHKPQDTLLKNGFCLLDFGARYRGYCADISRTIFLGKPTKKQKALYKKLLNCQIKTIQKAKIGMPAKELSDYSRLCLGKDHNKFIHGLGHGVGLKIHEKPSLKGKSKDVLKENMAFTIEPGIYYKNRYGIRIEDVVLLTKSGAKLLTKSKKTLIELQI